jgi:hypothetical protein
MNSYTVHQFLPRNLSVKSQAVNTIFLLIGTSLSIWVIKDVHWMLYGPFDLMSYFALVLLVFTILIGFSFEKILADKLRWLLFGLLIGLAILLSLEAIKIVRHHVFEPPEWDFKLFYTYGRTLQAGLNPYDSENLRIMVESLHPSDELLEELYFFYPPPTIFLFAPLGWFTLREASVFWYGISGLAFSLSILLMWKGSELERKNIIDLIFVYAFTLLLVPALYTIETHQTNFLVLMIFLLYLRVNRKFIGGVLILIGCMIKPISAIFLLSSFVIRYWKVLTGFFSSLVLSILLVWVLYGSEIVGSFFLNNPIVRSMPNYMYYEMVNQSLLANILRQIPPEMHSSSPLLNPIYLFCVTIFLVISAGLMNVSTKYITNHIDLMLLIPLALILYPKSLEHYFVLLIIPIIYIWGQRTCIPKGRLLMPLLLTVVYALTSLRYQYVFIASIVCWLSIAGLMVWKMLKAEDEPKFLVNVKKYFSWAS